MTEQEYMDIYDLGMLRAVQQILSRCVGDVDEVKKEAYKAMRKLEIKVNKMELETNQED